MYFYGFLMDLFYYKNKRAHFQIFVNVFSFFCELSFHILCSFEIGLLVIFIDL